MSGGSTVRVPRLAFVVLLALAPALALVPARADVAPLQQIYVRCSGLNGTAPFGLGVLENQIDRKLICWGHLGHHTYFVGNDTLYALHGGFGDFKPTETGVFGAEEGVSVMPAVEPGAVIETSVDGLAWSPVETVPIFDQVHASGVPLYAVFKQQIPNAPPYVVPFSLPDTGEPFRYLRIRQPMSADGALSGYMDGSELWLNVTAIGPATDPPLAIRTNHYDCGQDILEDIFAEHPCGFGQAQHFDSVSTYHTYPLGALATNVTRISGSALLVPFRGAIGMEACVSETMTGEVQASVTGRNDFRVVGTFFAYAGAPTRFDFENLSLAARFIRVTAAPCAGFEDTKNHPGDHFLEGFLQESMLDVTGNLPQHVSGTGFWDAYANDVAANAPFPVNVL